MDTMEKKYKDALHEIRTISKTPSEWFQTPWIYPGISLQETQAISAKVAEENSEKDAVLSSLNEFSEEKLQGRDSYKFAGGEIKKKEEKPNFKIIESSKDLVALADNLKSQLPPDIYSKRFSLKDLSSPIKVLFVTDEYEVFNQEEGELQSFFDEEVASLFGRMIAAMGLEESDYIISAIKSPEVEDEDSIKMLFDELINLQPKFVITLGATATNGILGGGQRLKNVHGKLFDYQLSDQWSREHEFQVMPLFSPKLLHTAPNMKKTAWKDMQVIMNLL